MKKRVIIGTLVTAAMLTSVTAQAQTTGELFQTSNQRYTLSTARSAAMGGAFTSLGADPLSMVLNPAGIAMYSQSEASATTSLLINNTNVTTRSGSESIGASDNKTKLALTNLSTVLKFGDFSFGLGYNRTNDNSNHIEYAGFNQNSSIGQVYANQLAGIVEKDISSPIGNTYRAFYNYPPMMWNAIMAYQTGLVNPVKNYNNMYDMNGVFSAGDELRPGTKVRNTEVFNEMDISAAYNYRNKLYFGLTMGVQNGTMRQDYDYYEVTNLQNLGGDLDNMTLRNGHSISSLGFNLKVGVTARPVHWLRIGVAYHSPTWNTYEESSYADMTTYMLKVISPGMSDTPILSNDYNARTPSRLNAGTSFTIAKRVIISADYERVWYGDMKYNTRLYASGTRLQNDNNIIDNLSNTGDYMDNDGHIDINSQINNSYKAANNVRLGLEAQVYRGLSIRAGINYQGSPYNEDILEMNDAQALKDFGINNKKDLRKYGEQIAYSAGLGFRSERWGVDLTYLLHQSQQLPTKSFYYNEVDAAGNKNTIQSKGYTLFKQNLHQVMLTFTFRFGRIGNV